MSRKVKGYAVAKAKRTSRRYEMAGKVFEAVLLLLELQTKAKAKAKTTAEKKAKAKAKAQRSAALKLIKSRIEEWELTLDEILAIGQTGSFREWRAFLSEIRSFREELDPESDEALLRSAGPAIWDLVQEPHRLTDLAAGNHMAVKEQRGKREVCVAKVVAA